MKRRSLLLSVLLALLLASACRKEAAPYSTDLVARCSRVSNDPLPEIITISDHQTGLPVEREFLLYNGNFISKETIVRYFNGITDTTFAEFNETPDGAECLVYYGHNRSFWQQRFLFSYMDGKLAVVALDYPPSGRTSDLTYRHHRLVGYSSRFYAMGLGGDIEELADIQYWRGEVKSISWTYTRNSPAGVSSTNEQFTYPFQSEGHIKEVSSLAGPTFERKAYDHVYSPYLNLFRPEMLFRLRFDPAYLGHVSRFANMPVLADLVNGGVNGLNSRMPKEVSYWNQGTLTGRFIYKVVRTNRQQLPTQFQVNDMNGGVSDVRIKYTQPDEE